MLIKVRRDDTLSKAVDIYILNHVVSTKAQMRFSLDDAWWLPIEVREKLQAEVSTMFQSQELITDTITACE